MNNLFLKKKETNSTYAEAIFQKYSCISKRTEIQKSYWRLPTYLKNPQNNIVSGIMINKRTEQTFIQHNSIFHSTYHTFLSTSYINLQNKFFTDRKSLKFNNCKKKN